VEEEEKEVVEEEVVEEKEIEEKEMEEEEEEEEEPGLKSSDTDETETSSVIADDTAKIESIKSQILQFEDDIAAAVDEDDYEKAAELDEKIQELKQQLSSI